MDGCCGTGFQGARSYLIKEECIALLKEYKDELLFLNLGTHEENQHHSCNTSMLAK
jgi:hypothetical protein